MSSAAQQAANHANAQLSTGPRTPAGKAHSAANAFRHGLSSRTHIVRDDEKDEFEKLATGLHNELKPEGTFESVLFDQILQASWTLCRASRLEAELINEDGLDPLLLDENHRRLQLIDLYRNRAERTLHRAAAELRRLQESRAFNRQTKAGSDAPILIDTPKLRQKITRDFFGSPDRRTVDALFRAALAPPRAPEVLAPHSVPPRAASGR